MPNLGSLTRPSLQSSNLRKVYFQISSQFLIKENCHNSGTNDDIDMKPGPITELDKRGKNNVKKKITPYQQIVRSLWFLWFMTNCQKKDNNAISANCEVICDFSVLWAIPTPDSRYIVCKTYIFINSNLLFCKNWKQN